MITRGRGSPEDSPHTVLRISQTGERFMMDLTNDKDMTYASGDSPQSINSQGSETDNI
jgi:hypothetical protein